MNENYIMDNVSAIVYNRKTKKYHVNYRWEETTTHNIALPMCTGNVKAGGQLIKSRKIHSISPVEKTRQYTANVTFSKRAARAMGRAFRNAGRVGTMEYASLELVMNILPALTGTDWDEIAEQQDEIAACMRAATR